jgi:hypothetical protein
MKTPTPTEVKVSAPSKRKFSAKSTATLAQYERIEGMLSTGDKSTIALRRGGVMMPAARIKEMNERHGYVIRRVDLRDLYDEEGFCHPRVAIYRLVERPAGPTSEGASA